MHCMINVNSRTSGLTLAWLKWEFSSIPAKIDVCDLEQILEYLYACVGRACISEGTAWYLSD